MFVYTTEQVKQMLPLLKHYSWFVEDLFGKLELLSDKLSSIETEKIKDRNKKEKATHLRDSLLFYFNLIEDRLFDIVIELESMNIQICSPTFGALDIPTKSDRGKLVYICFDHSIETLDEFLCHCTEGKKKKIRLTRYLDC